MSYFVYAPGNFPYKKRTPPTIQAQYDKVQRRRSNAAVGICLLVYAHFRLPRLSVLSFPVSVEDNVTLCLRDSYTPQGP